MTFAKGKEPEATTWPTPADLHVATPRKTPSQATLLQSQATVQGRSQTFNNLPPAEGSARNENHSSNTWTPSTENPDMSPEEDVKDDRERFVVAYNRLAQRNGIRPIVPGDFTPKPASLAVDSINTGSTNATNQEDKKGTLGNRRSSWLSKMLRQPSDQAKQASPKPDKHTLRRQPSSSFVPNLYKNKRDELKIQDLGALMRLCGKSPLFLPPEYAPFPLTLPTCFRALAQALVQHADTKGIFRISGSARVINELYDYYCTERNGEDVAVTTRCPTLPTHIRCNTHDVAGTFKRFLAGLPGGILGSLSLFDALVSIHSQLQGDPEAHRTKQSRLRARLIALAIGTVRSQYQRELICAVFGLLCLMGRIAENAPREDESGHPLPTTDLMGYQALGIVFGPLLVGDLINNYSMRLADPSSGLVLLPVSAPRSKKEGLSPSPPHGYDGGNEHEHAHIHEHKHEHHHKYPRHQHERKHEHRHLHKHKPKPKEKESDTKKPPNLDRIHIANSIAEMLIVHWREVVRQIRDTGSVKTKRPAPGMPHSHPEGSIKDMCLTSADSGSLEQPAYQDRACQKSDSTPTVSSTPVPGTPENMSEQGETTKARMLSPTIEESPSPRSDTLRHIDEPPPLRLTRKNTMEEAGSGSAAVSVIRKEIGDKDTASVEDPAYQWRHILASSKASTESLAKSTKERRLTRVSGHASSRASREALVTGTSTPTTIGQKGLLTQHKSEPKLKTSTLSSEKSIILNSSNLSTIPPIRAMDAPPGDLPPQPKRRSPSKPMPGAVKAMTALFDNAMRESPPVSSERMSTRFGNSQIETNSFVDRDFVDESPLKVNMGRLPFASVNSGDTVSPSRYPSRESPEKPFGHTLRPVKKFTAMRRELPVPPERDTYRPSKLGTTLPYPEEPPVGHFIPPSSATSTQGQNESTDDGSFEEPIHVHNRHTSGNSMLHAQIRSLQRQLDIRHEEILQIRRQLETQEHMDLGTLCEQLRVAKRECKMWRKRAEAAEKRVAMFQQFGAKFQALNDGVDEYLETTHGVDNVDDDFDVATQSASSCYSQDQQLEGDDMTEKAGYSPFYNDENDAEVSALRENIKYLGLDRERSRFGQMMG